MRMIYVLSPIFRKFVEVEEFATEGGGVGGPFIADGGGGQGRRRRELAVHIVQVMEDERSRIMGA